MLRILVFLFIGTAVSQVHLDSSPEALAEASEDWGHFEHNIPFGVVTPETVQEVIDAVLYAAMNGKTVVAQGRTHSSRGQAQAEDGIVIDMNLLNQVLEISNSFVWIESGATWRQLLDATFPQGLTPPVFTDYIDLSIGGTLSVGGKGTQSIYHGLQVDTTAAIEIVTGEGELKYCDAENNSDLFYAALAGYGQFGIITKAKISLIPAKSKAKFVKTLYSDFDDFLDDILLVTNDHRFDGVQGAVAFNSYSGLGLAAGNSFAGTELPIGEGKFLYIIEGVVYFEPEDEPSINDLTAGLNHIPYVTVSVTDYDYKDFIARLDSIEGFLRSINGWDVPHPWLDVFLPANVAPEFIASELDSLVPEDVNGPILIKPYINSTISSPNYPLPDSEEILSYGLLRAGSFDDLEHFEILQERNFAIYERARAIGGTGYAAISFDLTPENWSSHLGCRYEELVCLKQQFDPANILTPSQYFYDPNVNYHCTDSTTTSTSSTTTTSTSSTTTSTTSTSSEASE